MIHHFDLVVTRFIQSFQSEWLTVMLYFITYISSGKFLIIVISPIAAFYLYYKRYRSEALFSILIGIGYFLSPIVKNIVERARPSEGMVQVLVQESGYSFPSGHALINTIFYGFLLYLVITLPQLGHRLIISIALVFYTLLVGISRVYLGAHWPSDVVGGYLIGILWLVLTIPIYNRYKKFR